MRTIAATGPAIDPPTLSVSQGRGNTADAEVHLILREADAENSRSVMGWFNRDELLAAINDAPTRTRLSEPAADE